MKCPQCKKEFVYGFSTFAKTTLGRIKCPHCDNILKISSLKIELVLLAVILLSFIFTMFHPSFPNPLIGMLAFIFVFILLTPFIYLYYRHQQPVLAQAFINERQQAVILNIKNNSLLNFINRNIFQIFIVCLVSYFWKDMWVELSAIVINLPCGEGASELVKYVMSGLFSTVMFGVLWLLLDLINLARINYITKNNSQLRASKIDCKFWSWVIGISISGIALSALIFGINF
jgi:hypothetical protein